MYIVHRSLCISHVLSCGGSLWDGGGLRRKRGADLCGARCSGLARVARAQRPALCAYLGSRNASRSPFGLVVACPPQISLRRVLGSSLLGLGSPGPSPDGWPLVPPLDPAPSGPASGPPCGGSPRVEVSCFCFCLAAPFHLLAGQTRYLARARELRVLQTLNK